MLSIGIALVLQDGEARAAIVSEKAAMATGIVLLLAAGGALAARYLNIPLTQVLSSVGRLSVGGITFRSPDDLLAERTHLSYRGRLGSLTLRMPGNANSAEAVKVITEAVQQALTLHPELLVTNDQQTERPDEPRQTFSASLMSEWCDESKNRIRGEIERLYRRGNINLIVGFLTTLMAAFVLAYVALFTPDVEPTLSRILIRYIPRLSLALFIEIFSFFFLRLYRNSLNEVRFFQNELSNIEARCIALASAFMSDSSTAKEIVIDGFLKTERNFILKQGETTTELEKSRVSRDSSKDFMEAVLAALKTVRGRE